jgi:hypothetical protein
MSWLIFESQCSHMHLLSDPMFVLFVIFVSWCYLLSVKSVRLAKPNPCLKYLFRLRSSVSVCG